MATRLKECRCGRKIPIEWPPDCPECEHDYALRSWSGEIAMRRADRRLTALQNRGLEKPGLDPSDPVVAKVMDGVWKADEREALLVRRQVHNQLAGAAALARYLADTGEEDS